MRTVSFDLEPEAHRTRLKLSHRVQGTIDDEVREIYTTGWQELLGQHLKRFIEQHKGYREMQ